jgi:choline dehydrogenase-like flavoprotein
LSADPSVRVLLLEAGGADRHPFFHMPGRLREDDQGHRRVGLVDGAATAHEEPRAALHAGQGDRRRLVDQRADLHRGAAADYDDWEREEGATGLVVPRRAAVLQAGGEQRTLRQRVPRLRRPAGRVEPVSPLPICEAYFQAGQEMGIPFNADFNGERQDGLGYYQLTQLHARRSSASVAYLGPIRGRRNLTVLLRAQALRLLVERGRAVGVEIVQGGERTPTVVRAAREVIVSSGAFGSPKLLMQSGIGDPQHLESVGVPVVHALPGVGNNLQDHLDLFVIAECTGDHTYDKYNKPWNAPGPGCSTCCSGRGRSRRACSRPAASGTPTATARSPDIQFHLGLGSGIEAGVARMRNAGSR